MSRSYEPITNEDLQVIVELARKDREDLFMRKQDTGRPTLTSLISKHS